MKKQLIHIDSLGIGYNRQKVLLSEINLTINRGEVIVLLGDNGSGKSTLLKTIGGLLKPVYGTVLIEEKDLNRWGRTALAQKLAFVSSLRLSEQLMKVKEFVAFGRYPYLNNNIRLKEMDKKIIAGHIKNCGIEHLANKPVGQISDGEKQKVAIARAFTQETDFLILDEPTTHLDIKNSRSVLQLLKQSKEKTSKSILFSSHQVEKAIKIADKVWLIKGNQVLEFTAVEFLNSKDLKSMLEGDTF